MAKISPAHAATSMQMKTCEFTEDMIDAVVQFNARIRAGGGRLAFPASHIPQWFPPLPGRRMFQQFFLVVDAEAAVRGAYILKHRDFSVRGEVMSLADFQLPISEGSVDRKYTTVGVRLLWDAMHKHPLLYALGMGGHDLALPRLLQAAGWKLCAVPFYFRVVRPFPFLRNITYLRNSLLARGLLDGLAYSGLGWLAIRALYAACYRGIPPAPRFTMELVDEFQDWTDELWNAQRAQYGLCGVRDRTSLQMLYPRDARKFIRLQVHEGARPVGWAVLLNTPLSGHKQFGDMRLGSIVDGFSAPADAVHVVRCARAFLEEQGVDLVVSNQSHWAWSGALRRSGFMCGPSNFVFASSATLTRLLAARGIGVADIHVNRGDGDGPIHL